jgi:predicted alpha/beta-hydrolase family hydrolase
MPHAAQWRVRAGDDDVTAVLDRATTAGFGETFVFAHGAGGRLDDRGMVALAPRLCALGLDVVRFNFPYSEKRGRRPDPMPVVMRCIEEVCAHVRREIAPSRMIIGGRSMGGRAASMLAADGYACDALLLFAYPLHPAGKPEQLRDAHLARIRVPVLCVNGTRDTLCRRDLMEPVVARLAANWTMHWLDGADHSFHVTKASGRTDGDVLDEVVRTTARWLSSLRRSSFDFRNAPA